MMVIFLICAALIVAGMVRWLVRRDRGLGPPPKKR